MCPFPNDLRLFTVISFLEIAREREPRSERGTKRGGFFRYRPPTLTPPEGDFYGNYPDPRSTNFFVKFTLLQS